jgi:AcrR family transcriptional regulator
MEAVAARAGVGKATVYRRYGSRFELVADAVAEVLARVVPEKDRGSLRADLNAVLAGLTGPLAPRTADVMLHLATEALHDGDARLIWNEQLLASRRAAAAGLLERAGARGELAQPVDPDTLLDLIGGALLFRAARKGGHVDNAFRRELLDVLVAGLASSTPIHPKRRRPAAAPAPKREERR